MGEAEEAAVVALPDPPVVADVAGAAVVSVLALVFLLELHAAAATMRETPRTTALRRSSPLGMDEPQVTAGRTRLGRPGTITATCR